MREEVVAPSQATAGCIRRGGTEITHFNALRHDVLSRYTVLPWEDAAENDDLLASLVFEHAPQGPTALGKGATFTPKTSGRTRRHS